MSNKDPSELISSTHERKPNDGVLGILGAVALIALIIGAIGSLIYMYRQGQDTPRFLLILFTIWVLAPFAALFWANMVSKRWSVATRAALYCATVIVALLSLAIYSEWIDVKPVGSANAFLFVAVPPISLLFAAIVVPTVAVISGKLSQGGK